MGVPDQYGRAVVIMHPMDKWFFSRERNWLALGKDCKMKMTFLIAKKQEGNDLYAACCGKLYEFDNLEEAQEHLNSEGSALATDPKVGIVSVTQEKLDKIKSDMALGWGW